MTRTNIPSSPLQLVSPPRCESESDCQSDLKYWDLAPDEELICIYMKSGAQTALDSLIRRHGPVVAQMLSRLLSHPQDQEDAFQATFLVFVKSIGRIRKKSSVCSYLIGVALRIGKRIRSRRMEIAKQQATDVNIELHPQNEELSPFERLAQRLHLAALDEELQSLPETTRTAIVEHYYAGLSVPQIAESMQLSVSAVEGRIKRGKRLLRSRLAVRGVSMTAVLGAIASIPNAVSANILENWSQNVLQLAQSEPLSTTVSDASIHSSVQDLIQGELQMQLTTRTSWLLWTGGICAVATIGLGVLPWSSEGESSGQNILLSTSEGQSIPDPIAMQVGQQPDREGVGTSKGESSNAAVPAQQSSTQQNAKVENPIAPTVVWKRPDDNTPPWRQFVRGSLRKKLAEPVDVNFDGVGLASVVRRFSETLDIPIVIDARALEEEGVGSDQLIALKLKQKLSFHSALNLILKPLNLTYSFEDEVMKIISRRASKEPVLHTYDLSYILPDNSTCSEVVNILHQTVSPDCWDIGGGNSVMTIFGSLLVVSCPIETHEEIANALDLLGNQSPQNIKPLPVNKSPQQGMGGGMF